jgi:hypothetical protein
MNLPFIIVPTVQLRYKQLLIYNKFHFAEGYHSKLKYSRTTHLRMQKTYSGSVTNGAKKRMAKAIDCLLMVSPKKKIFNPIIQKFQTFQLTFITLTIADNTKNYSAKESYDLLLSPFLKWLREKQNCKSYIWKLELQERGQIHYHLTTNEFIEFTKIRNKWNELQSNCGMLDDYKKRFGNTDPNSTDIHAVYKVQDIKKYLLKYLSKSEQNAEKVNGKIWDCSKNLKGVKSFEFEYDNIKASEFLKYLDHPKTEVFQNDHCMILTNKEVKTTSVLRADDRQKFNEWFECLKNV